MALSGVHVQEEVLGDGECQNSLAKRWLMTRETRGAAKREALTRDVFHNLVPPQTCGPRLLYMAGTL